MLKFITLIYSKYLKTLINNYLKYLFLILVILTIVISYVCVIQTFTNRYEYTLTTTDGENSTEIFDKNQKLEILRNSDNPGNFTLSTDKNIVSEEGIFTLSWTPSEGADNYSIYSSTKNITIIDGDCTLVKSNITHLNYTIVARDIGLIYYIVEAYNISGSTLSNSVRIQILEIADSSDSKDYRTEMLFPSFFLIPIFLIAIILLLSFSGIMRYKAKRRHYFNREHEEFQPKEKKGMKNIKSGKDILNEQIDNKHLLNSIEEGDDLSRFELSSISADFSYNVDKFKWNYESQKVEFIKEMFALTPEEREDIINYMGDPSRKNDFTH